MLSLQTFYEMNHETLKKILEDSYFKVLDSDLLKTMV